LLRALCFVGLRDAHDPARKAYRKVAAFKDTHALTAYKLC
jgi:hypothetical protein